MKKCIVLQMNDSAVIGFKTSCICVKGTALLYTDYRTDWMGEGREERGDTPLTVSSQ